MRLQRRTKTIFFKPVYFLNACGGGGVTDLKIVKEQYLGVARTCACAQHHDAPELTESFFDFIIDVNYVNVNAFYVTPILAGIDVNTILTFCC